MRLEKIVLDGFKSFAEKTEFSFGAGVTGIVGPNGCGKSNIVDAVKWVLGEQSVKSLRSDQMADVIFGGSSSRKALGSAEVSLLFLNTSGKLPIEGNEVQISRRIYKSGESEYRINNKVCRLKDIRELFMDTGVGTRAYSIIEQGQVEQLLTSSKTERRAIFEEAAGISKYKAHKKEAFRKLERTEQNLLRLADILGEVQRQLRSVKLQAGKARNYLQYSERLKELQVNYSLVEYAKNDADRKDKQAVLEQLEGQRDEILVGVAKNDALLSELGQELIEKENAIKRTDNSLVSAQSKIEHELQRIEFLRSRLSEMQQREKAALERIEQLKEQRGLFEKDLEEYTAEQRRCEQQIEQKRADVEGLEKSIAEISAECVCLEAELEDEKSGIIDIVRRTAQLHNEVQSISIHRSNLSSQKDRLAGRASTARAEMERLLTEKAQQQARLNDIEKVLEELERNLDSKRKDLDEVGRGIVLEKERLSHSKEARSALSGELAILRDMESRREGLNSAVKKILNGASAEEGKFGSVAGVLADIVRADVEYANAVEAALEGRTDALVVESTSGLLNERGAIEELDGRVNFICMDRLEPFVDSKDFSDYPQTVGRVVEFVNYESKYAALMWKLLGKTIVVDSIEGGLELRGQVGSEYAFVTLKGELIGNDGSIKVGPVGKTTGLISRKSRLRQLEETIGHITDEISALAEAVEKKVKQQEHLEKLCTELRTAIYEASTEKMQVGSQLSILEENIKRLKEEEPLIASEMELLEEQIAQAVQKEYDSEQKLRELEAVNNERTARIKELEEKYSGRKAEQEMLMSRLTDSKVALGQLAEQSKGLKQTIASLEGQVGANSTAVEAALGEAESCREQFRQAESNILSCEAKVSELFVEKEKAQDSSRELHSEVEELLMRQKQIEQFIKERRSGVGELEERINQLRVELGQVEVKQQDLVERVREELGIDLAEAYEDYTEQEVDWGAVREEMAELRGKIERLGNVNVGAIEEQENLEKRNEFLSGQVEDLNKSKRQLEQLISRLNKKSREKFRETFEEVRFHFQQVFRKLFGGGRADIVLEEADDILEAGIEIIARPPGKETRSISLLSGGEKTMTAIALLFSVFKAKPSPFCLLDEVDAALDEANNERFNLLVREFQKDSQFIIITHSKRTMSIADVLFGITMQTQGVSKKISVRFGEYDEVEGETAAVA